VTQPENTIRTFIALETPPWVREVLAQTIGQLRGAIPGGVRWQDPTGIHLTLKFLGNIDPHRVDGLLKAMADSAQGSPPFQLRLAGLGAFPNQRQPRVLWVGLAGDLQSLQGLHDKVEEEVQKLAPTSPSRESRSFHPHLTLGRVREGVSQTIRGQIGAVMSVTPLNPALASPPNPLSITDGEGVGGEAEGPTRGEGGLQEGPLWLVDSMHLIRSTLTAEGPLYTSLGAVPLGDLPEWKT
jgi:2'-5' RNA ligase